MFKFKLKLIENETKELENEQIEFVPKFNYKFKWRPQDNSVVKYIYDVDKEEVNGIT